MVGCYGTPRSLSAIKYYQPTYQMPTLGGGREREEPQYVAYWEGQCCIPRGAIVRCILRRSRLHPERSNSTSHIEKVNAASERRANLSSMISSRLSSEKKIQLKGPYSFQGTTYLEQEAFGSKPQVSCHPTPPGFWCQVFKHAVLLRGRYKNPLYSGQRNM